MSTIYLDRHLGILNSDGTIVVYNVLFHGVIQAINFLRPYPCGPNYKGVMVNGTLVLQTMHESEPPMD